MSKNQLSGLLVGMHFRPPAKLILECLPGGTALQLESDSENPYDAFAVKVLVRAREVPVSQLKRLEDELPAYGWQYEDFLELVEQDKTIWLGFLAAEKNKALRAEPQLVPNEVFLKAREQVAWENCQIGLGFSNSGAPLVVLTAGAAGAANG